MKTMGGIITAVILAAFGIFWTVAGFIFIKNME